MANNKRKVFLTTVDNPFDPLDEFDQWYKYDEHVTNHCCCGLLARFTSNDDTLSQEDELKDIENAIDRIIEFDDANIYVKLIKE